MNVKTHHDASYLLKFINDYSCFGYVYLISNFFKALDCFKCFLAKVENKKKKNLKILQIDRGCEYLSHKFQKLYKEKGISRRLTILGTP